MTTEEALAVAEAVQFEDEHKEYGRKRLGTQQGSVARKFGGGGKRESYSRAASSYDPESPAYDDLFGRSKVNNPARMRSSSGKKMKNKRAVHIQHVEHMHFSEAVQFADAHIERQNNAQRNAMRRVIEGAPIHPALKFRLLQHSYSVQFEDDGDEVPSISIPWLVRAIEQFAHPLGIEPSRVRVDRSLKFPWGSAAAGAGLGAVAGMATANPMAPTVGLSGGMMHGLSRQIAGQDAEEGRQEEVNHRLALNNELGDVSEEEAAQVREFLASLRHG